MPTLTTKIKHTNRRELLNKKVGYLLYTLREDAGFTMEELADLSGVSTGHISVVECGRHSPTIFTLSRLLTPLKLTIFDFFNLLSEE